METSPLGGLQLAGKDLQEGGFAGAVGIDDAVAVALGELKVHMGERRRPPPYCKVKSETVIMALLLCYIKITVTMIIMRTEQSQKPWFQDSWLCSGAAFRA